MMVMMTASNKKRVRFASPGLTEVSFVCGLVTVMVVIVILVVFVVVVIVVLVTIIVVITFVLLSS